jgi:YD repeat-containing protein
LRVARAVCVLAFTALAALATLGAPSASATALCAVKENPCRYESEFAAGTKIEAPLVSGTKATFLTNAGNVACTTSVISGETTSGGAKEKAVEAKVSGLTFTGCKFGETSCTVTVLHLPYSASFSSPETFKMEHAEGVGATVKCGLLVNCTFTTKKAELKATGGNPAILTASKIPLERKGTICPAEAFFDAEYSVAQPKPLFLVSLPTIKPEFGSEEGFGLGNPGAPNVRASFEGEVVNLATGNLVESQTDLAVGGRGPALEFTRTYNSQLAYKQSEAGTLGYGWTGTYSAHLTIDEKAETATAHQDNGSTVVFSLVEGKYVPASWVQAALAKKESNYLYTLPSQLVLEFNSSGQLTKETDRHGNTLSLTYKEGKLETVKDGAERKLTFTYNAGGQIESVKDPMGHLVKYTYESGKLATVTLPGEETARWKFGYDASRQLTTQTDGRSNTTTTEYDGSHRVSWQKDPLERKRTLEYAEPGGVKETTITEPNTAKTVEKFNEAAEPTSVTEASGTALAATTTSEYRTLALAVLTDPNKHTTKYTYDGEGNLTTETDANNNEYKWTYNTTHDVKTATTPKGETTTYVRNSAGDPETIERSAPGAKTQKATFKYAANGDLESETDPLERKTTFEYDSYGDRKAETDEEGDKRTWKFNEDSQLTSEVSPRGNEEGAEAAKFETTIERDAQGRAKTVTDPLTHETKYKYDANGNLETITNAKIRTTTYTYDADNERTKVKKPDETIVETGYDSMGLVKSRTNGNLKTTKYEHNLLEELTEEVDPLERKTIREYDAAGNLEKLKDAAERTTTYTYDAGDRLKEVKYSEEATKPVTYGYDKDGDVTEMKDGTGTSKYVYDELDRLTELENGNKESIKYGYDLGEEQTKVTYPNGKSITRGFDKAGRLEKVTDWLSGETKFAYNRDSSLTATTFPTESGNKDEYEVNAVDDESKVAMKKGVETPASVSYARDKLEDLESSTQTGLPGEEKLEFGYDENERLTKSGKTTYKYDGADSPTTIGAATYSYDKASQLEKGGGVTYAFDKLGERTKATPEKGPATTYGYDQAGNLISVKRSPEGETEEIEDTYAYDGSGLRTSQTIKGTTTHMAWDTSGSGPLLLYDGSNYYLYGPDGLPFEQIAAETPTYLHHDQQGSTRLLTNSKGESKGTYTFSPYGVLEGHTGTATTPLGYEGEYASEDTGLIDTSQGEYDPGTAQNMTSNQSPAGAQSPYSSSGGNPAGGSNSQDIILQEPELLGWIPIPDRVHGPGAWRATINGESWLYIRGTYYRSIPFQGWVVSAPPPPQRPRSAPQPEATPIPNAPTPLMMPTIPESAFNPVPAPDGVMSIVQWMQQHTAPLTQPEYYRGDPLRNYYWGGSLVFPLPGQQPWRPPSPPPPRRRMFRR